ncbi:Rieske 2Fe-2S domain-containing protein [Pseudonocardia ailaonensis]|uniref:cholesterol 7-desaturase n=1 Tax=Pseudonocardia ailaonensis TaxID=367279 RepID=A0ABN2N484_9PSEU
MEIEVPNSYATGWYQIGWSRELDAGDVKPVRYFDQDLVMFRGESGAVRVLSAHCAHLGANLGYGGTVAGDDIICPFHGWRWSHEGQNVDIPYADRTQRNRKLACSAVRETHGIIWMWYDQDRGAPEWDPPFVPEYDSGEFSTIRIEEATMTWRSLRLRPQWVIENVVDAVHLEWVHKYKYPCRIESYGPEGTMFRSSLSIPFPDDPDNRVMVSFDNSVWGVGTVVVRGQGQKGRSIHIQSATPVDSEHSDFFAAAAFRSDVSEDTSTDTELSEAALRNVDVLRDNLEADIVIWQQMEYIQRPPLTAYEAKPYFAMRRWSREFYPEVKAGT